MNKRHEILALVMLCTASILGGTAQNAAPNPLSVVKRIYVGNDFGKKAEASGLRKELINNLKRTKFFEVVASPSQADAVLTGSADVYVKSYFSLNPRSGVSPNRGEPIYGGSLSVELKDKNGDPLWSYLSTSKTGMTDPSHELAKDVIKHLLSGITKEGK